MGTFCLVRTTSATNAENTPRMNSPADASAILVRHSCTVASSDGFLKVSKDILIREDLVSAARAIRASWRENVAPAPIAIMPREKNPQGPTEAHGGKHYCATSW
jgi:hypothetical protein